MAYIAKPEYNMLNFRSPQAGICIPQETCIRDVRLAAAYVPFQNFCTIFSPLDALKKGTAFPELYSPYDGKDSKYDSSEGYKREDEI